MKKSSTKEQSGLASEVFSRQELEVFRRVFDKLSKGAEKVGIQKYVQHIRDMTRHKEEGVLLTIVNELERDGDVEVDFAGFVQTLEEKVGSLATSSGLQRIFTFLTRDPLKKRVTLEDLQKTRGELGLTASDKDLQRLVDFVTVSHKERSDFTFEEFERYALKQR
jgi:Ca2+-binding EF-hand superfamily protein